MRGGDQLTGEPDRAHGIERGGGQRLGAAIERQPDLAIVVGEDGAGAGRALSETASSEPPFS